MDQELLLIHYIRVHTTLVHANWGLQFANEIVKSAVHKEKK